MKYVRFEDLPVWNAAINLGAKTFEFTATGRLKSFSGFRDQIERAAVSVSNNIAEGFERGTHDELIAFLYIARGSAGEVRSMLALMERLPGCEDLREVTLGLREIASDVTHQLNRWLQRLKETDSKGPRHKTAADRDRAEKSDRRNAFLKKLDEIRDGTRTSLDPP